jgi:hypothetical protein
LVSENPSETGQKLKKSPYPALVLIFLMLCLSIFLLFDGASDIASGEVTMLTMLELIVGLSGILLLTSALQRYKKIAMAATRTYRVITVTECKKCGFKDLRHFRREDYIMKKPLHLIHLPRAQGGVQAVITSAPSSVIMIVCSA